VFIAKGLRGLTQILEQADSTRSSRTTFARDTVFVPSGTI
jgi:hypothetical protein